MYPFEYKTCEKCGTEFGYRIDRELDDTCPSRACNKIQSTRIRMRVRNAQVGEKEATAVARHPKTGEIVYCFDKPDAPMPEAYAAEGFEKVQFPSYSSLQKFCREQGVVNDLEGDYHNDDGYFEEDLKNRRRKESSDRARYMEEREKIKQALRDLD